MQYIKHTVLSPLLVFQSPEQTPRIDQPSSEVLDTHLGTVIAEGMQLKDGLCYSLGAVLLLKTTG
jgi:hypothetical protein